MASPDVPKWLKSLPLAPEYRPSETEFADPIAFISRIEREAAAFGICKVIPPLPKPSKKFVLSNLRRSLSNSDPDSSSDSAAAAALFTTRQQELGSRKARPAPVHKLVWQSGEQYTLDQFEAKSKAFARSHLGSFKEVTPLLVESLFWKAASEKPIYVEYANDVPGSGFAEPEEPFRYFSNRRKRRKGLHEKSKREILDMEGTAGWKLSNSPWNLQVIARSPGSITRFMPDEVPGVTSPMVYIGMLFSWFAWHVEDHELHSLNFLHMGSPKTWYAVPGEYASTVEEIVRVQGYGGNVDRLEAFSMLGEKTTLLSPEMFVAAGVPCCRLVQNPGEFVVTFPRAYHVGFSHGFNCGEAANFATSQWLKVAKEAAVRRAAMNHLPMLSHQQLLYMLTMSFVSRVPSALLSGVRSSRLKDRKREDREILVKKAFLNDMMDENDLLRALLSKESTSYAVLWEPDLLPSPCPSSQSAVDDEGREKTQCKLKDRCPLEHKIDDCSTENSLHQATDNLSSVPCCNTSDEMQKSAFHAECISDLELLHGLDSDDGDLPFGLNIDSGSLACVACGILGYPFMAIVQPSERAAKELFSLNCRISHPNLGKSGFLCLPSCSPSAVPKFASETGKKSEPENLDASFKFSASPSGHVTASEGGCAGNNFHTRDNVAKEISSDATTIQKLIAGKGGDIICLAEHQLDECNPKIGSVICASVSDTEINHSIGLHLCNRLKEHEGSVHMKVNAVAENDSNSASFSGMESFSETDRLCGTPVTTTGDKIDNKCPTPTNGFMRPRIFCLQHALEVEELLHSKGGAHVLIICHSDYVKIKAYASSIAEETGTQFKFNDVPLENASSEDLDLIYVSIDDEHEQLDEDWTSKLGVNLRYCLNARKELAARQEQLSLALGRIFSDPHPVPSVPTLKWCSRRSRTPYKVLGIIQTSPAIDTTTSPCIDTTIIPSVDTTLEKSDPVVRNSDADSITELQVYRSRRRDSGDMTNKHYHPKKGIPKDFGNSSETAKVESKDDIGTSGHNLCLNEKGKDDNLRGLFSVPISAVEDLHVHQNYWVPLKVCTSNKLPESAKSDNLSTSQLRIQYKELNDTKAVSDCDKAEGYQIKVTVIESSEMHQELNSAESVRRCKVGTPDMLELKESITEAEVKNTEAEMHQELNTAESVRRCKAGTPDMLELEENITQAEVKNSEGQQEIRYADVSNLEREPCNIVNTGNNPTFGTVSCFEDPEDTPVVQGPSLDRGLGESLLSLNEPALPVCLNDNFQIQLEAFAAEGRKHEENIDISAQEGQHVNDVSFLDKFGLQQEQIPSAENKVAAEIDNLQLESRLIANVMMAPSEVQQETHLVNETEALEEVNCMISSKGQSVEVDDMKPVTDDSVAIHTLSISVGKGLALEEENATTDEHGFDYGIQENHVNQTATEIKSYVRRRYKRKREEEQTPEVIPSCSGFIRGPCEGLRPRTSRTMASEKVDGKKVVAKVTKGLEAVAKIGRRVDSAVGRRGKEKDGDSYKCNIEGCQMSFGTSTELQLHKRNRCTHKGCGKRFASHKYAMRHQHVHNDIRPLKCPWNGCSMTFKWAWARTEHIRIHTGERPYKCTDVGCGQTFRYVSDFSRHRRKTGHCVNSSEQ